MAVSIHLKQWGGDYAVCQLSSTAAIPEWADGPGFVTISRTDDELSIVCLADRVPDGIAVERGWLCFKFQGPFPFDAAGIILSVIRPLSENGIGVFIVATFDGDVLLLKADDFPMALPYLVEAGHRVD